MDDIEDDPYNILGLSRTSTVDEIRRAFKDKALTCHPDKNPDGEALFKRINAAYSLLVDERRRAEYDRAPILRATESWNNTARSNGTSPASRRPAPARRPESPSQSSYPTRCDDDRTGIDRRSPASHSMPKNSVRFNSAPFEKQLNEDLRRRLESVALAERHLARLVEEQTRLKRDRLAAVASQAADSPPSLAQVYREQQTLKARLQDWKDAFASAPEDDEVLHLPRKPYPNLTRTRAMEHFPNDSLSDLCSDDFDYRLHISLQNIQTQRQKHSREAASLPDEIKRSIRVTTETLDAFQVEPRHSDCADNLA